MDQDDLDLEAQLVGVLRGFDQKRALQAKADALQAELETVRGKKAPGAAGVLGMGGIGRLQQLLAGAGLDVHCVSGRQLCWYGISDCYSRCAVSLFCQEWIGDTPSGVDIRWSTV